MPTEAAKPTGEASTMELKHQQLLKRCKQYANGAETQKILFQKELRIIKNSTLPPEVTPNEVEKYSSKFARTALRVQKKTSRPISSVRNIPSLNNSDLMNHSAHTVNLKQEGNQPKKSVVYKISMPSNGNTARKTIGPPPGDSNKILSAYKPQRANRIPPSGYRPRTTIIPASRAAGISIPDPAIASLPPNERHRFLERREPIKSDPAESNNGQPNMSRSSHNYAANPDVKNVRLRQSAQTSNPSVRRSFPGPSEPRLPEKLPRSQYNQLPPEIVDYPPRGSKFLGTQQYPPERQKNRKGPRPRNSLPHNFQLSVPNSPLGANQVPDMKTKGEPLQIVSIQEGSSAPTVLVPQKSSLVRKSPPVPEVLSFCTGCGEIVRPWEKDLGDREQNKVRAFLSHMILKHKNSPAFFCRICRHCPSLFGTRRNYINGQFVTLYYMEQKACLVHLITEHGIMDVPRAREYTEELKLQSQPKPNSFPQVDSLRNFVPIPKNPPTLLPIQSNQAAESKILPLPDLPEISQITNRFRVPIEDRRSVLESFVPEGKFLRDFMLWNIDRLKQGSETSEEEKDVKRLIILLPRGIQYIFEIVKFDRFGNYNARIHFELPTNLTWEEWFEKYQKLSFQSFREVVPSNLNRYRPPKASSYTCRVAEDKGCDLRSGLGPCKATVQVGKTDRIGNGRAVGTNLSVHLQSVHTHDLPVSSHFKYLGEEATTLMPRFYGYFLEGKSPKEAGEYHTHQLKNSLLDYDDSYLSNTEFMPRGEIIYFWHFLFACEKEIILDTMLQEELGALTSRVYAKLDVEKTVRKISPQAVEKSFELEEELAEMTKPCPNLRPPRVSKVMEDQKCCVCGAVTGVRSQPYHVMTHYDEEMIRCPACPFTCKSLYRCKIHIKHRHPHKSEGVDSKEMLEPISVIEEHKSQLYELRKICFPLTYVERERFPREFRRRVSQPNSQRIAPPYRMSAKHQAGPYSNKAPPAGVDSYKCEICLRKLVESDLETHVGFHLGKQLIRCPCCSYSSALRYSSVKNHILTKHERKDVEPIIDENGYEQQKIDMKNRCFPTYFVEKPDPSYKNPSTYDRRIPCAVCERQVALPAINHHAMFHVGKHFVRCPHCNYSNRNAINNVRLHIKTYHAEMPPVEPVKLHHLYKSEIEEMKKKCFPQQVQPKTEELPETVNGIRLRERCEVCKKTVLIQTSTRHAVIHLGLNLIRCPLCSYSSVDNIQLVKRHLHLRHRGSSATPINERSLHVDKIREMRNQCFPHRYEKQKKKSNSVKMVKPEEMEDNKDDVKWEPCTICGIRIKMPHSAAYHARTHLGKNLSRCPICPYASRQSLMRIRRHISVKHPDSNAKPINDLFKCQSEIRELRKRCFPVAFSEMSDRNNGKGEPCMLCRKRITKPAAYRHATLHTGKHLVKCPVCSYTNLGSLFRVKLHIKEKHPESELSPIDNRADHHVEVQKMKRKCFPNGFDGHVQSIGTTYPNTSKSVQNQRRRFKPRPTNHPYRIRTRKIKNNEVKPEEDTKSELEDIKPTEEVRNGEISVASNVSLQSAAEKSSEETNAE